MFFVKAYASDRTCQTTLHANRERKAKKIKQAKRLGPAKKGSQNLNLKLLEMLAISQFKARFQARNQF